MNPGGGRRRAASWRGGWGFHLGSWRGVCVLSSLSGEHLILKLTFMCTFVHVQKTFLSRMSHVSTFCMFDFGMLEILWTAVCAAASLERVRTKFHRAG